MFEIRFWNSDGACVEVGGKYSRSFESYDDAWESAEALLKYAYEQRGAVEMDINGDFYWIYDD